MADKNEGLSGFDKPATGSPITLDKNEMAAGLVFEREIAAAQMALQQASIGRNAFTGYLKTAKGVPADWEILDWEIGFEPPEPR